ncbi:hypothetical protein [Oscillatoria acuminata]|uniref:Uncharacterized protein n=1 Tax=Oscillatoria acuminata PCC 6304 TaxID=56110 RepID=K9TQE5_9CYAN|nr:hypothetical protein [Oscillatoria acuminata]AFY84229.1 hypothetical protein Oscil6304_4718 [Oscillatoria acuminata PCC 6304]
MSQDPPTPSESDPQIPTPANASPPVPPAPKPPPSGFKALAIATLRSIIQLLEGVVEALETEPIPPSQTPTQVRIEGLGVERQPTILSQILAPIRALLPTALNQTLSDWGLTGAIALIVVVITWTTTSVLFPKPAEVAQVPFPTSSEVSEMPPAEFPPVSEVPTTAPEFPSVKKEPPPIISPKETNRPKKAPPVVEKPPAPLTPEQTLIAAIQSQVAQVTEDADIPIASIQANFGASQLLVRISDEWYNITAARQDKLASQIFERGKELDFRTVEIADSQGNLLARSPVVGSRMIIVKRQQE